MADLAGILVAVMERKGLTDSDVASAAGIGNATTVYRWRSGRTNLTERKLARVLVSLGEDPTMHGLPAIAAPNPAERREAELRRIALQVEDLPEMATRLEIIMQDLAAIREHLGIGRTTGALS